MKNSKARILFIHTHDLQEPCGGARRTFQNYMGCVKYGHCDTFQVGKKAQEFRPGLEHCMTIHPDECNEIVDILKQGHYDVAFFDTSLYGDAVKWIQERCENVFMVVHAHNFEKKYFEDENRADENSSLPALAAACEQSSLMAADIIVFISSADQRAVYQEYGFKDKAFRVIPPALTDNFDPDDKCVDTAPYVLFLGSAFFGSIEAGVFLLEKIAPRVNTQIVIAGTGMDAVFNHQYENAKILGYVPSLAGLMNNAAAFVSPVFSGSGSKIKIAEALMHGKYIIATEDSLVGYDIEKMAVTVCKTEDDFVQAIAQLDLSKTFYPQNRELFLKQHEMSVSCFAYDFLEVL